MRSDHQRVRSLLVEAITILCKNSLSYDAQFCVEGLLGITVDEREVFLVNIKENIQDKMGASGGGPPTTTLSNLPINLPAQRRPLPARSPFITQRTSFHTNRRGRARGWRGTSARKRPPSHPSSQVTVPNNQTQATPIEIQNQEAGTQRQESEEPPLKKQDLGTDSTIENEVSIDQDPDLQEIVQVKQELDANVDADDNTQEYNNEGEGQTSNEGTSNNPLASLDFSDMMQNFEGSSDQQQTLPQQTVEDSKTNSELLHVIKPEHQEDSSGDQSQSQNPPQTLPHSTSSSSSLSQNMSQSQMPMNVAPPSLDPTGGGLFATPVSGPVFPGAGMSGQFIDPSMPGYSGWSPQMSPPSGMPRGPARTPPSRRGRPSAAAGSPRSGGPQAQDTWQYQGRSSDKPWQCPVCHKGFTERGSVKVHMESVHERSRLFRCKQCGFVCNRSTNLRRHIRNKHGSSGMEVIRMSIQSSEEIVN